MVSQEDSNKLENQEILMLSLHLLQVSLVYVNTLMIQQVLGGYLISFWKRRTSANVFWKIELQILRVI